MSLLIVYLTALNLSFGQTFQIYNGDTINVVDANNMKQGHWIYFGNMKQLPGFAPEAKVEEGEFANNRKEGVWVMYYPDGATKSEITFAMNRPKGHYKTYYPNGIVEEEGDWSNNRNTGHFERRYENGQVQQDFNFADDGKRNGQQKYFYENGQLMIDVTMDGGKETGEMKEYYADGSQKSVKYFNGGVIDPAKTQKFEPKNEIKEVAPKEPAKESQKVDEKEIVILNPKKTGASADLAEGHQVLYNKNRQISQKGTFKDGRLWDGQWYRYDENGILTSIEIYKGGKYVGEGVIEE